MSVGRVSTWLLLVALATACSGQSADWSEQQAALSTYADRAAWSKKPPGLEPVDVPQFVAVTFVHGYCWRFWLFQEAL